MIASTLLAAATPFVDLTTGAAASMAAVTLSIARRYFVLAVLLGFLLEAFGPSPTGKRDLGSCTWRAVVVMLLLAFYPSIFGSVVNLASDVAAQVTPPSVYEQLGQQYRDSLKTSFARPATPATTTGTSSASVISPQTDFAWRVTGGLIFDGIVTLLATTGLAVTWLITALAGMLVTLFYIIGPLALAFAVPRMSDTGTRWFTEMLTICSWPIFSGLLLQITVSLGTHLIFGTGTGPLATVSTALLMTACAIATPVLASRLVGGSVKSAASHGAQTAASFAPKGHCPLQARVRYGTLWRWRPNGSCRRSCADGSRQSARSKLMRAKLVATVPGAPPAVWSAFAKQAAWKDWIIVGLLVLNALTVVASARIARQQPDVVLIAPDGKSTYLPHAIEGDALARFLADQKQLPSDVTIIHFTRQFLQLALAVNSSTVEGAWPEALAMMSPELREHVATDASAKKLIDTYRAAKVRIALDIDAVELVAKTSSLLQVHARVRRKIGSLLVASDGANAMDRLEIDLVERIVPRTSARPDGLELVELRVKKEEAGATAEGKTNVP